jgi:hypothetical protein
MDRDNASKYSNNLLTHTFYSITFSFLRTSIVHVFLSKLTEKMIITYNSLQSKLLDVPAVEECLS